MPFDLKHIESFIAVAEARNFSVAAARTNTVQSAISAHIKQLEHQVGRALVTRGRGQPVALTPDGIAFLAQARRLLALAEEMARHPGAGDGAPPLRLGTTVTFALSVVPPALSACAQAPDTSRVTVRTARSHALLDLLETDRIDLAFLFDQGPHPMRVATTQTELVWVACANVAPPVDGPLPLAFLEDARDLRRHAFAALDSHGAVATSLQTHPDPVGLRAVLAGGLAVSVLPCMAVVAPLADVGARLGLPPLGQVSVSVYARRGHRHSAATHLGRALIAATQSS
ncbi:LysR family transcriptional regulator [Tropicimonas sp. S265A]|uniref:LysR family transcriptional regulator n=1 Tax=Tropicimonas sp. S265A TaxID=3415134 RepID=UPI003C7CF548